MITSLPIDSPLPNVLCSQSKADEGLLIFNLKMGEHGIPIAPFKAAYFSVQPECSSPIDSHAVRELWLVAQGEGELTYESRRTQIRPFDVLYFDSFKTHQVRNSGVDPLVIFSVWWD